MYKCPHATALLEGRADGIYCRGCGTLFKSFADINPEEKKKDKIPPGNADNGNGAADNMTPAEPGTSEGADTEPPAEDEAEETAEDEAEETAEDEAEAKPKAARRGRPKKEEADNA